MASAVKAAHGLVRIHTTNRVSAHMSTSEWGPKFLATSQQSVSPKEGI